MQISSIWLALLATVLTVLGGSDFGELIFEDRFERSESQERKDEPGNGWTTSSDKTANGHKQVDLRDGHLYVYTHKEAWHATSVRHAFAFTNGTVGIKLKFDNPTDSIKLNFTDLGERSVHAGHLFNVEVSPKSLTLTDLKTGVMNLTIRRARKSGSLSDGQRRALATKSKRFPLDLATGKWHQLHATVVDDEVVCLINGVETGRFRSPGFAHQTKTLLRLLVPRTAHIDDVQIWRQPPPAF